jgi:hypothetical protein
MTIGDFINDPFGTVAKAGLDAAPDGVRETLHGVAESVTNTTLPDPSALADSFSGGSAEPHYTDGPADVGGFTSGAAQPDPTGAAGEIHSGSGVPDLGSFLGDQGLDVPDLSGVDVRDYGGFIQDHKENWDTDNTWGQPEAQHVDSPDSGIIHPDPMPEYPPEPEPSVAEQAAGSGAAGVVDSSVIDDLGLL